MDNSVIVAIIGVFATVMTHLLTKRKYNAEVDNSIISSLQESLKFYKDVCTDNRERLNSLMDERNEIMDELNDVRQYLFNFMSLACMKISCTHREGCPESQLKEMRDKLSVAYIKNEKNNKE